MDLAMFRGIVPFVAVAEEGSVRRAAVRLAVSPAAVSKAVAKLEAEVGLPLLARGGRRATLTREGEVFFGRCRPAVAAVAHARAALEEVRREPAGELVLSVPFVATMLVAPVLATLRRGHPRLRFCLHVTEEQAHLAEEKIDVAVRLGPLADSSLVARRLQGTRLVTVASPAYLAICSPGRKATPRVRAAFDAFAGRMRPLGNIVMLPNDHTENKSTCYKKGCDGKWLLLSESFVDECSLGRGVLYAVILTCCMTCGSIVPSLASLTSRNLFLACCSRMRE